METNFLEMLNKATKGASDFITENITQGKKIVFLTEEEIEEDENMDIVHTVPYVCKVGKFEDFSSYGILSIEGKDDDIILRVIGKYDSGGKFEVSFNNLGDFYMEKTQLCDLADLISKNL
jgi:hypothetical protein